LGQEIKRLKENEHFGELALISQTNERSATAKCLGLCEFLILNVEDIKQIKEEFESEKLKRKEILFKCVPELDSVVGTKFLEQLMY
jgi:CRP-like cAMP-binding protein